MQIKTQEDRISSRRIHAAQVCTYIITTAIKSHAMMLPALQSHEDTVTVCNEILQYMQQNGANGYRIPARDVFVVANESERTENKIEI